jgi:hypothetical protein
MGKRDPANCQLQADEYFLRLLVFRDTEKFVKKGSNKKKGNDIMHDL